MATKKVHVFCCNRYSELVFLCNVTDRHEIRAKIVSWCALLNLIEEFLKFSLEVIFPQNGHF